MDDPSFELKSFAAVKPSREKILMVISAEMLAPVVVATDKLLPKEVFFTPKPGPELSLKLSLGPILKRKMNP